DQRDGVAALLVVEERIVELGVLDDAFRLVFAERFGVLLPGPRLDLPAGLAVERGDAGESAEGELLSHLVRTTVLVGDDRLESSAAIEMAVPPHGEHGVEALRAAHSLRVAGDDLVGRLKWLTRRVRV